MIINILILSNAITIIGILILLAINKKYYNILKENNCIISEKHTEVARMFRKCNALTNSIKDLIKDINELFPGSTLTFNDNENENIIEITGTVHYKN